MNTEKTKNSEPTPREEGISGSGSSDGSPVSGYRVARHFTRQGLRRADMTPQWFEESKKKFGEIHGPFPIANPGSIDFGDNVMQGSCVVSILRDEETGIEDVTVSYSNDVDA